MNRAVGLAFLIGLVLLSDLAVVTVHVLNDHTSLVTARGGSSRSVDTGTKVVPGAGQEFVTGDLDHVTAENAQVQPLMAPFTVTALERGVGRVTIEKALMGDRRVTITWDSGTPLPISGSGGLDLGATHVDVDKDGPVFSLDGAVRAFLPGSYALGTSVAVGTGGLATPRDGVQFTADQQTTLQSKGNVIVHLDARKLDLLGPGKVTMSGKLKVQYPDRTVNATAVSFADGPYRVTVDPGANGLKVDSTLQGPVDVS